MSLDISVNTNIDNLELNASKLKKEKSDNCQELKNIAYKTMLLNGNDINPKYENHNNNDKISKYLETDITSNKNETWVKLDKTQKIKRLDLYASTILKDKYELSNDEVDSAKKYLHKCIERKNLSKSKEVNYNKEESIINNIPYLIFNEITRIFLLKKDDKHVSTLKSLPPEKKNKVKTIKNT
jgi:hypothetical protein